MIPSVPIFVTETGSFQLKFSWFWAEIQFQLTEFQSHLSLNFSRFSSHSVNKCDRIGCKLDSTRLWQCRSWKLTEHYTRWTKKTVSTWKGQLKERGLHKKRVIYSEWHRDIKNVAQNRHLLANVIHPGIPRTVIGVGASNETDHIKVYFLQPHELVLS